MKKICFMVCTGICAAVFTFSKGNGEKMKENLFVEDVEALSACESVGWWDNNGNCVNDGKGTYFCKRDTWHELTDCKI